MKNAPDREVVGYIRVSSDEQAQSGLSLENQKQKILAYAESQDLKVARIYHDDQSAKDLCRPEAQEMLARVESGKVGRIIVFKLDRLTRSVGDLSRLLELFARRGVTLSSVSETLDTASASGRMVVHIIGVISEWERGVISERTRAALSVKRSRGEKLGRVPPYGWKTSGKKLIKHPEEQCVLKSIIEARREGRSFAEIARNLNATGTKPRSGRIWYASTIRGICTRHSILHNRAVM